MEIRKINSTEEFENLVDWSALQFWSHTVFENLDDEDEESAVLVTMINGQSVAYSMADSLGLYFIETKADYRRQGFATKLIEASSVDFVNDVCSEDCKALCESLDLEYDEVY